MGGSQSTQETDFGEPINIKITYKLYKIKLNGILVLQDFLVCKYYHFSFLISKIFSYVMF